jgi:sugar lactone lactonase YvrE
VIDGAENLFVSQGQMGNQVRGFSSDGNLLWSWTGDEAFHHYTAPTLGDHGVLYVTNWTYGASSGYLYAIVPEPSMLLFLASGGLLLMRRTGGRST